MENNYNVHLNSVLNVLKTSSVDGTKLQILDIILGLTGSNSGLNSLYESADTLIPLLLDLIFSKNIQVSDKTYSILINIAAEDEGAKLLTSFNRFIENKEFNNLNEKNYLNNIILVFMNHVKSDSINASQACKILANMSRNTDVAYQIYQCLETEIKNFPRLLQNENEKFDYLALSLSNLSRLPNVQNLFLKDLDILRKLISLINSKRSVTRRCGIIGTIRNFCFSSDNHETLLNPDLELLSHVLLPLAGPERFDDEDNEKLPLDLQYLPNNKTREPESSLRIMLLEVLMQLCTTQFGRNIMRQYNIYIILREYHKWEKNMQCLEICEDLVNILIRTEDEIGIDNLQNVDIPKHLIKNFEEFNMYCNK